MQDLSLNDVAWIFGSLITLVIVVRLARPAWLLLGALRQRYLVVDWSAIRAALADDMSSDGDFELVPNQCEAPEPDVVRAHQNQVEPLEPAPLEPAREPPALHNHLSSLELITLLAVQRNEGGSYRFSANEILEFVGGTAADVKHTIREVRGEQPPPAQAATGTVRRPVNGW